MTIEDIKELLTLLSSFGLGAIIAGFVIWLLLKNYIPSYINEKAKNLAKIEDIEKITAKVEEVKTQYSSQIQDLIHQNNLLLEQARSKQQLRLAALDKRLQAHQEAFALWRKMISNVHNEQNGKIVMDCQEWYNNNCLYLDSESREAFISAYGAMSIHPDLLQARDDAESIKRNFLLITSAGTKIVRGAELPSLGPQESELVSESGIPNKLSKGSPQSGAPS